MVLDNKVSGLPQTGNGKSRDYVLLRSFIAVANYRDEMQKVFKGL
jgi:hypothetical protein